MEIAFIICIIILIFAIIALLYSTHKDKKGNTEEIPLELTNETKIRLQFEKMKSEISLSNEKANFFKNLADLTALINVLLIIVIVISGIAIITGMTSCAGLATSLKF